MPEDSEYPWAYRCSRCDEIIIPENVREHSELERGKPDWPGYMSYTRVDSGN